MIALVYLLKSGYNYFWNWIWLAGVAGVAVSLLGSVGPNVGGNYIVGCFMVVVLGGVGNLLGTVLASFGIGIMTDLIGAGRL